MSNYSAKVEVTITTPEAYSLNYAYHLKDEVKAAIHRLLSELSFGAHSVEVRFSGGPLGTPKPTVTVEETTHLSDCAMWSGVLHEPCTCAAGTDTTTDQEPQR